MALCRRIPRASHDLCRHACSCVKADAHAAKPDVLTMGAGRALCRARAGHGRHQQAANAMPPAFDAGIAAATAAGAVRVVVAGHGAAPVAQALLTCRASCTDDGLPAGVGPGPATAGTGGTARFRLTAASAVTDLLAATRPARAAAAIVAAAAVGAIRDAARRRWRWGRRLPLRLLLLLLAALFRLSRTDQGHARQPRHSASDQCEDVAPRRGLAQRGRKSIETCVFHQMILSNFDTVSPAFVS